MTRKYTKRKQTIHGIFCPVSESHGVLLMLTFDKWWCPHEDHYLLNGKQFIEKPGIFQSSEVNW